MPRSSLWLWLILSAARALFAAEPQAANPYVNTRVCETCHADAARAYHQTGMGRSLYRPTAANQVEDYAGKNDYRHVTSGTSYAMESRNGAYYQRRWTVGFGGEPVNVEEARIDYVIGSGNHSRSYLHRTERGTLIELPLSWYSEKGGFWAMSPGFDSLHPPTRRLVSYECMFCHNGYPAIPAGHDAPGSEPVFTGDLPEGIDCQRCHGPGGRHVKAAQTAGADGASVRAAIVNPARLTPKLRMDICLQCHMEPTSTALPALVRRFNRGPYSFTPGESLSEFLLAFDHAPGSRRDDKFEIVGSSAYRLRKSRCFLESKEAMTCDTCHNPHRSPSAKEAPGYYAQVCRSCHAAAFNTLVAKGSHTNGPDCVACHMPKRRTEDVVHVVMTDHRIQRRAPAGDLLAELEERHPKESAEYRGEVVPYFPDIQNLATTLARTGPDALYRAFAQVAMGNNLKAGIADFARLMMLQQPREAEWSIQLGDARLANGEPLRAVAAYEAALRLRPQMPRAQQAVAKGARAAGQLPRSLELLRRATAASPQDAGTWYQLAGVQADLGRNDEAIKTLGRAIALDPDLPGAHVMLARAHFAAGQMDEAADALRDALRIDPYESSAWDLAGRVLTTKGAYPEAFFNFEQAIRYSPDFAPHVYDYALALSTASEFDRAETQARKAIRANPAMAEAHVLLGGLLARKNQFDGAAAEYGEAVRLRPASGRTRLDFASVLVAQGKMTQATEQLRLVAKSDDPEAARIAVSALQRLGQR